jgi:hypothetical protein
MSQAAMSVSSHNDSEADDVLEQMLLEAERLAAMMRATRTPTGSVAASSTEEASMGDAAGSRASITSRDFTMDAEQPHADVVQVSLPESGFNNASLASGSFNDATLAAGSFGEMEEKKTCNDDCATVATDKTTNTLVRPETAREEKETCNDDSATVATDKTMNTVSRSTPVSAAVEAARKMTLALEALGATMNAPDSSTDSPTSGTSSAGSDSPFPATPDSFKTAYEPKNKKSQMNQEGEIVAPNTMSTEKKIQAFHEQEIQSPSTPLKGVEWQKVDMANEGDDDFVPLVDYSSPSPEQVKAQRHANNAVMWEKVNSAHDGDDDYVPLADYSPPASPQRKGRSALTRSKLVRSRKKARRRKIAAVLALVVCVVYWFYYQKGSSTNSAPIVTTNKDAIVSDASSDFDLQMGCADPSLCTTYREDSESQQSIALTCETDAVVSDEDESPVEDMSNDAATENVESVKLLAENSTATTKVVLSPLQWFKAAQDRVASGEGHFVEAHHLHDLLQTMLQ